MSDKLGEGDETPRSRTVNKTLKDEKAKKEKKKSPNLNSPRKRKESDKELLMDIEKNPIELITTRKVTNTSLNRLSDAVTKTSTEMVSIRSDVFGNKIKKGAGKKHKISFRDKISRNPLIDEVPIESFKKFNVDISKDKAECNCACLIF